jgi:ELWxxDGT repeat protein
MVKDILSGSNGTYPYALMNVNSILYFRANDGTHGLELWRSDGTTAGTVLVKDINSGAAGSNSYVTHANGTLYFLVNDGTQKLWKSNGTTDGTVLIKSIDPGFFSFWTSSLVHVTGTLYFRARNSSHAEELWKSDGTPEGTVLVKDIWPGGSYINSGAPSELTQVNNALYFRANDGTRGIELWKIGQNQVVTFDSLANQPNGQAPFDLVATASSGLPVSFSVVSGPATISGHTLSLSGDPGTVIVRASQAGDLTYNATFLERSFNVTADTTHSLPSGCQSGRLVSTREEGTLPEVHVFSVGQTIHARFTHLQVKEVETTVFNRLGQVVDWFGRQRVEAQQMSISSKARQGDIYVVRFVTDQGTFVKKLYLSPQ